MWRTLMCMGVGLLVAVGGSAVFAEDQPVRKVARDIRGRIVRVVPADHMIVVQTGTGPTVKEVQYIVSDTTKYWGIDQRPFTTGLRYQGFKPGTDVWVRVGDDARTATEVRFYDPATEVIDIRGKIVRVDPQKGIIVIRSGEGTDARDVEYTVEKTTQYWGTDEKPFTTALRYEAFRPGANVWYRVGPRGRVISEVRFYDPTIRRPRRP